MLMLAALPLTLLMRTSSPLLPNMPSRAIGCQRCGPASMLYDRGEDSGAEVDEARIRALIFKRDQFRRDKDFAGADAVRTELLEDLEVTLWDRDRLWMHGATKPPKKQERKRSNYGFRIFVENLAFETEWTALKDHFAALWAVLAASMIAIFGFISRRAEHAIYGDEGL